MKIAVIGADGQLGTDVVAALAEHEVLRLTIQDLDITDRPSIAAMLDNAQPDTVVNTAAFHDVPKCEVEHETAWRVNAWAVSQLAEECAARKVAVLHVSTDYVFDGCKQAPYIETDLPRPQSTYAITKLAGEHYLQSIASRYFVVRTCGLYGHAPCIMKGGKNFPNMMLKLAAERDQLKVVNNEILTPTSTASLGKQIAALVASDQYGVYHATNQGQCSWYEFTLELFRLSGVTTPVVPVPASEFPSPVRRPAYSVLQNAALQAAGLDIMPAWQDALAEYLQTRPA